MSDRIATIIGAAIAAIATTAGVIVQAVLRNRADAAQRGKARESDQERQRREVAHRYLFQLRTRSSQLLAERGVDVAGHRSDLRQLVSHSLLTH